MTTTASPSTLAGWRRRREEIAVALDHEAIDDRQAANALLDFVDDILATLADDVKP